MKKFFFSHPDVMLAIIALILLAVLFGFFSWGINDVVMEVRNVTVSANTSLPSGFNLQAAAQLNLHGLSTSTSATVPAVSPSPASVPVVTSTATTTATASSSK